MDNLFSIGEVSDILGITLQTLRYYNKIGLVNPGYINPQTGYRYYTYGQLSQIDRIRYLQSLGLSLKEIQSAMEPGNGKMMIPFLKNQLEIQQQELKKTEELVDTIKWYIDYFQYPSRQKFFNLPYKRVIGERYCLAVPVIYDEYDVEMPAPIKASLELRKMKSKPPFGSSMFIRQDGSVIDYENMLHEVWSPKSYFAYFVKEPEFEHPNIMRIPAGEYLCFQGRPLAGKWDASYVRKLLSNYDSTVPKLVVADEYEENLNNFNEAMYEIQILISLEE